MELYAEAFERANALPALEGFASHYGPRFYGLPANTGKLKLTRAQADAPAVPKSLPMANTELRPLNAGETLRWQAELLP